ncbi:MAG TPA: DUF4912 domain-containing protein [Chthoniobacteraceae bacterium]|jgi:hypothetical protein|nr:DUF4912 domain-containing protein [Chthoniobacteraceae bacterium]
MGNSTAGQTDESDEIKPKKNGAFQLSKEPLGDQPLTDPATHKYETAREHIPDAPEAPAFEDLGELPQSYGENTLFLIARDPHWLFAYWDVDWAPCPASTFYLKLYKADGGEEMTTEIHPDARNWYIPVKEAGASYYVELGYFTPGGEWSSIIQSERAEAPQNKFSDSAEAEFATVPIHLTFQRLVDMVRTRMRDGESLISALSRLQGEGRRLLFQPGRTPEWTEEQRQVLAALFGREIMDRIAMGSAEIDQLLRQELLEKLSTESASELVSKSRLAELLGPVESSLFSAYAAGGLGAAFSSEVTSWSSGLGSSWSAQPFGQAPGERGFFMHVNAEVIFYGGTDPNAKVWIDGRQIQLAPDGTFRFHFRFPDGNYSIPIVAESPDGLEQRSAALRFERGTVRAGDVGHTAQPGHLGAPMGKK